MSRSLLQLHAVVASVLVAVVVIQALLAGHYSLQAGFGYTVVGLVAVTLVVSAAVARAPRVDVALALGLLALYFVQTVAPSLRGSVPAAGTLQPASALLLFGLAVFAAVRAFTRTRSAEALTT